jgi:hypothetical protein
MAYLVLETDRLVINQQQPRHESLTSRYRPGLICHQKVFRPLRGRQVLNRLADAWPLGLLIGDIPFPSPPLCIRGGPV